MYNPMTIHKWGGLGDGRLTAQQLTALLDAEDDRYVASSDRIRGVDIVIIDEVSMLSKCLYEKLEHVMSHIRGVGQIFGGAQIVLVGDFLQLHPVVNSRYNDPGDLCFESSAFPTHNIFLTQVIRQKDQTFINILKNIAVGNVDDATCDYVKQLGRPIPSCYVQTTRLFSCNILSDMYNRDCLTRLAGDVYEFEAIDEGEERHLASLTVQKTLWLKKNAKVMLLRNLSDQLVNGLCGRVVNVREGEVDVYFSTLDKITTITRMNFAVYDPVSNRNLAVRNQVPLKLCYAVTVHKAQGMTLESVEVDCRQMFQPGQLAVAMGRVKSPDGLRVVNFTKDAVIPQPAVVLDFVNSQGSAVESDLSCCHFRCDGQTLARISLDSELSSYQPTDCDIDLSPEFDDGTSEVLANVDIGHLISESNSTQEPPNLPLPSNIKLEEEIQSMKFENPVRENQTLYNQWIEYLLHNKEELLLFCTSQYCHLSQFFKDTVKTQKQKEHTAFFKAFQMHVTSSAYKASVLNLMPESEHVDVVFNLGYDIVSILRKNIIQRATDNLQEQEFENVSKRQLDSVLTDTAKGKIRYIGGYIVAKHRHRTNLTVQKNAFKSENVKIEKYELAKRTLKVLHYLTCSEMSHTDHPESLKETARKQNINRGLTNITDKAYKFFEHLISTILSHLSGENLNKYGADLHRHVTDSLNKDTNLHEHFLQSIREVSVTEEVSFDSVAEEDNIDDHVCSCLHELTYNADVVNELYFSVLAMASSVLFKQFSKDVVSSLNIKKKMEHRKQVHVSTSKESKSQAKRTKKSKVYSKPKIKEPILNGTLASAQQDPVPSTSSERTASSDSDEEDHETTCPRCNKVYYEGEDWICCDSCDKWFDRKCAGLTNVLKWRKSNKPHVNFYCPLCQ